MKIIKSCPLKGASSFELKCNSVESETATQLAFHNGGQATAEVEARAKYQKYKSSRKVKNLNKIIRDVNFITEFTKSINSTRIG